MNIGSHLHLSLQCLAVFVMKLDRLAVVVGRDADGYQHNDVEQHVKDHLEFDVHLKVGPEAVVDISLDPSDVNDEEQGGEEARQDPDYGDGYPGFAEAALPVDGVQCGVVAVVADGKVEEGHAVAPQGLDCVSSVAYLRWKGVSLG